ncbi:hypothetical protein [Wolbachia endosymbiont of Dirofilaria (Dirofilaria) immitis]|uniref:hypothetical protein n=1 Tax=Wolbachia endosymbiont of Dirofilaria (Dirofilaria) immitis TaxID=1812115 RepID=UPI00158AF07E|nr:hypothetical protein [Wolbachia endosymbiont of Dirofilaria (Dirofilaria) immitis]QKX02064.1 hypothetical protein GOY12_00440 [Wolbachia endosymbiont of Dirofilaria (Dirofilaria) immitis]
MHKIFIYTIIFLLLFIPTVYSSFWYFYACNAKNLLAEIILYINNKKFDVSHDFSGFPFNLTFHVTNPKFSNEQLTISSNALLIKNRLFDRSVYIYIPSNEVSIAISNNKKESIRCHTNNNNHFITKLKDLPFSLLFNKNSNVIDYIDTFRYEDYGSKCDVSTDLENHQSIITEVNGKSNYIQFYLNKELSGNNKLGFDFYTYRYKNTTNPESYLSIDTKFNYEFVNHISAARINFNIEKFLIQSNNFSLAANGGVNNYNLVTSSFKDKINVAILNYKELISFMTSNPQISDWFKKLISSLSEETTDDNVNFSIKYDTDAGLSFIGKLPITDFMNQLDKITELVKNENGI